MFNALKLSVIVTAFMFPVIATATPLVVDGSLSDWGVQVGDYNTSQWSGVRSDLLGYMEEDQNDNAGNSGYVGPEYGGQNYDGEFMGVARSGQTLYIGISTGQRSDNGFSYFAPGDLLIETDQGTLGLEMGGGSGGTGGAIITEGQAGSTYTLNAHGYTVGHLQSSTAQVTGSLWSDVDLIFDPISPHTAVQFEINQASQLVTTADFVYSGNTFTNQHAVYEIAFDLSTLSNITIERIFWAPSCGNDELYVDLDLTIPEPLTGLLLIPGIALFFRRYKSK